MTDLVYARCLQGVGTKCREIIPVHRAVCVNGKLLNRCPHCRGKLEIASKEEVIAYRAERARLEEDERRQ